LLLAATEIRIQLSVRIRADFVHDFRKLVGEFRRSRRRCHFARETNGKRESAERPAVPVFHSDGSVNHFVH
jgi:hypothetical protein